MTPPIVVWLVDAILARSALEDVPPEQDVASLQRPSRPMIEVAQQYDRSFSE
jgi:hypothetical protein